MVIRKKCIMALPNEGGTSKRADEKPARNNGPTRREPWPAPPASPHTPPPSVAVNTWRIWRRRRSPELLPARRPTNETDRDAAPTGPPTAAPLPSAGGNFAERSAGRLARGSLRGGARRTDEDCLGFSQPDFLDQKCLEQMPSRWFNRI